MGSNTEGTTEASTAPLAHHPDQWVLCPDQPAQPRSEGEGHDEEEDDEELKTVDISKKETRRAIERCAHVSTMLCGVVSSLADKAVVPQSLCEKAALSTPTIALINGGLTDDSPIRSFLSLRPVSHLDLPTGTIVWHKTPHGPSPRPTCPATPSQSIISLSSNDDGCGGDVVLELVVGRRDSTMSIEPPAQRYGQSALQDVVVTGVQDTSHPTIGHLASEYLALLPPALTSQINESTQAQTTLNLSTSVNQAADLLASLRSARSGAPQCGLVLCVRSVFFAYSEAGSVPVAPVCEVVGVEGIGRHVSTIRSCDAVIASFDATSPTLVQECSHIARLGCAPAGGVLIITVEGGQPDTQTALEDQLKESTAECPTEIITIPPLPTPAQASSSSGPPTWRWWAVDTATNRQVLDSFTLRVQAALRVAGDGAAASAEASSLVLKLLQKLRPDDDCGSHGAGDEWAAEFESGLDSCERDHEACMRSAEGVCSLHAMTVHHLASQWIDELTSDISHRAATMDVPVTIGYTGLFSSHNWQQYAHEVAMLIQDSTVGLFKAWSKNVLMREIIQSATRVHRLATGTDEVRGDGAAAGGLARIAALKKMIDPSLEPIAKPPAIRLADGPADAVLASETLDDLTVNGPALFEMEFIASLPHEVSRSMGVYHAMAGAGKALSSHAILSQFSANVGLWVIGGAIAAAVLIKQLSTGTASASASVKTIVCDAIAKSIREKKDQLIAYIGAAAINPIESFMESYDLQVREGLTLLRSALNDARDSEKNIDNEHDSLGSLETKYKKAQSDASSECNKLRQLADSIEALTHSAEGASVKFEHVEATIADVLYNNKV